MTDQRDNIAQAIMDQGGGLKYTAGGQLDQNDAGNIAYYYKMMGGGGGGAPAQPAQAPTATPFPQAQAPQEAYQLPQPGPQGGAYGQPAGGGGGLKMINGQIDQNDAGNIAAYYRMMGGGGGGAPQQPAYQPQPVAYSPQGVAAIPGNFGPDQVQAMGPQIMQLKAQGQQIPDWQQQVLDAYQGGMAPGTTLAIRGSPAGGMGPTMGTPQIQAPGGSYGDGAGISNSGGGGLGGVGGGSDFAGGGGNGSYNPFGPTSPYSTYGASQGSGAAGGFGNQGYEAGWAGQGFPPGSFGSIGSGSIGYDTGAGDVPGLNGGGIGMYPGWGGFGA